MDMFFSLLHVLMRMFTIVVRFFLDILIGINYQLNYIIDNKVKNKVIIVYVYKCQNMKIILDSV